MSEPISNEAVEAAKQIHDLESSDGMDFKVMTEQVIQSAITKACAERDTQHRLDLSEIRRQHQQEADEWKTDEDLSAQLAVMKKALEKIKDATSPEPGYCMPPEELKRWLSRQVSEASGICRAALSNPDDPDCPCRMTDKFVDWMRFLSKCA